MTNGSSTTVTRLVDGFVAPSNRVARSTASRAALSRSNSSGVRPTEKPKPVCVSASSPSPSSASVDTDTKQPFSRPDMRMPVVVATADSPYASA